MANDDEKPPHTQGSFNPVPRYARESTSRSSRSLGSYETGESSTAAGDSSTRDSALISTAQHDYQPAENTRHTAKADVRRRLTRVRPTGGFLLSEPGFEEKPRRQGPDRDDGRRRSRLPVDSRRAKSPIYAVPGESRSKKTTTSHHGHDTAGMVAEDAGERGHSGTGREHTLPNTTLPNTPLPTPNQPIDLDSTQIVSMALNLSESRRMAQRRNVSTPAPPRLAQVPDSPVGGSLKQHLQQQRRSSRNISPTPGKSSLAPRNVSLAHQRLTSPLQASFEPESTYTYHFSSSTLNRTQKAKEHFELMAQYRRLLDLVPPLQYKGQTSRPSTSSPPTSPILGSSSVPSSATQVPLGRPYNPLQYIRNRKVRARERKAIDGEAQGFAEVNRVTAWVDQVAMKTAMAPLQPDSPSVPIFPATQNALDQSAISNASKAKRPRIDWFIEPADLVADLYWVEQDDNKSLIEDRHYNRIFPYHNKTAISRPMSQETNEPVSAPHSVIRISQEEAEVSEGSVEQYPSGSNVVSKAGTEASHVSARDRARQKLHELKGLHHRHSNPAHGHHDFLHLRKSSYSDTSDSDVDRRKFERTGTISADGKAILEKQMNEMLAKEAIEAHKINPDDIGFQQFKPFKPTLMTPEKLPGPSPLGNNNALNQKASSIDAMDFERSSRAQVKHVSPIRSGRASLEVPGWNNRASMDFDTSAPSSPDLKASRSGGHHMPAIGMDLSPPGSRPGSPVRNPFSKVKNIFRDRSRDRGHGSALNGRDERLDSPIDESDQFVLAPIPGGIASPRRRSRSPMQKPISAETHKSHKSMGSLRLGKDDQVGLRNIMKGGAKIEGIFRGGVSKVSDFLWKKDQDSDSDSSGTSSEESETESTRGRSRTSVPHSRANSRRPNGHPHGRNYLDIMPPFKPASEIDKLTGPDSEGLVVQLDSPTRTPSRRSARFDKLKPPRIDVLNASPTSSPISEVKHRELLEAGNSDTDSRSRDSGVSGNGPRKSSSHLNTMLSLSSPAHRPHRGSLSTNRHWSISDNSPPSQRSTQLSKREVARLRTLALSSGIKAMEIARRAVEPQLLSSAPGVNTILPIPWSELSPFIANTDQPPTAVPRLEVYATTANILISSIESSDTALEKSASSFIHGDMRKLHERVDALHSRVATELIDMTRRAADEADECSRDMVDSQRLKVKRVVDIIDKMLRRRRRRFRWARRGGWLMVEWALVGFMWYVWFVVMILRIFLGIGRGVWGGLRWLLWL